MLLYKFVNFKRLIMQSIFKKYISTPINQQNKDQAYLPSKAKILENKHGTAPGMYFQENKKNS